MRPWILPARARESALPARAPRRPVFAHINPLGNKGGAQQQQQGWGAGLQSALQSLSNMAAGASTAKVEQVCAARACLH